MRKREDFEPDPEIHVVSPDLTVMLARFPEQQVEELVNLWFSTLAKEHQDALLSPTPEVLEAVKNFLNVCRVAKREGIAVLFTWSL